MMGRTCVAGRFSRRMLAVGLTLLCIWVTCDSAFASKTFFPITPIEVTPATATAWTDVNVSSNVPVGATGVILHVVNTAPATRYAIGLRKNGSTDSRTHNLLDACHCWAAIGVDDARIFEAYVGSTTLIDIYLVGYTKTGVTFFTNAYNKSPATASVWTDINCATEAPGAIGLIFEVTGQAGGGNSGLRMNGSSDSRIGYVYIHNGFGAVIGCDANQICEGYIADSTVQFFLVGYITDGAVFNTNATNVSLGSTGGWIDLSALPATANMAFIEVTDETGGQLQYGLRKNGSSEEIYRIVRSHCWGIVECDASKIIEGKIATTNIDFFVVGYSVEITAPTVTTSAASSVEQTTATGNGTIAATGEVNCTRRGFCYMVGTTENPTTTDSVAYDDGSFGTGAYTKAITGLGSGTSYRVRAYAVNSVGTGYGATVQILTKPAAPTGVAATDGTYTNRVVITWTNSTGATGYQVYRDGVGLGWLGAVATYDDTGAAAPTIAPGSAAASDGTSTAVALSLSGTSANNGTTHTYTVRARNATGESVDSATNTGYRGVGTLTCQWQRSAADSDADYSDISGATTVSYDDTGAPADGSGRYYRCRLNATGASEQYSTSDRGHRRAPPNSPTSLLCEGQASPTSLTTFIPKFSAVGTDNDGDQMNYYALQVSTDPTFATITHWDQGKTAITTFSSGTRSPDITYADSTLSTEVTYYWRIKFWDVTELEGAWSTETATFRLRQPRPPGISPDGGGVPIY